MNRYLPYEGLDESDWEARTGELVNDHPLDLELIKKVVFDSWKLILNATKVGDYTVGKELFLGPVALGTLLHEIIPLELEKAFAPKKVWKKDTSKQEKDLEYLEDNYYSIEIKTSSDKNGIYGNRSYAQPQEEGRKSKDGYFLAVNFEAFSEEQFNPKIVKIRFGWLNHSDWKAQNAQTGQQAYVKKVPKQKKLMELYNLGKPSISYFNIRDIVSKLNQNKVAELEEEYGVKLPTIKRKAKEFGYELDRKQKLYLMKK